MLSRLMREILVRSEPLLISHVGVVVNEMSTSADVVDLVRAVAVREVMGGLCKWEMVGSESLERCFPVVSKARASIGCNVFLLRETVAQNRGRSPRMFLCTHL